MPTKMTPKSQAKSKTPFLQYPFLAIFIRHIIIVKGKIDMTK